MQSPASFPSPPSIHNHHHLLPPLQPQDAARFLYPSQFPSQLNPISSTCAPSNQLLPNTDQSQTFSVQHARNPSLSQSGTNEQLLQSSDQHLDLLQSPSTTSPPLISNHCSPFANFGPQPMPMPLYRTISMPFNTAEHLNRDSAAPNDIRIPLRPLIRATSDISPVDAFHQHLPFSGFYSSGALPTSSSGGGQEVMRVPSASPPPQSEGLESPISLSGHARTYSHRSRPEGYDTVARSGSGSDFAVPTSPTVALPSQLATMSTGYLHAQETDEPDPSSPQSASLTSPLSGTSSPSRKYIKKEKGDGHKSKTKLTDMDRKFICVYAGNHPKARQEDIAVKFNVERSTVSKILKSKDKWMKVDFFSSEARTVKHRPSKFPELEADLIRHLRARVASREQVNDGVIKKIALELAQAQGIGKDKFKASSGWVENFKHRHEIRRGVWVEKKPNLEILSVAAQVPAESDQLDENSMDGGGDEEPAEASQLEAGASFPAQQISLAEASPRANASARHRRRLTDASATSSVIPATPESIGRESPVPTTNQADPTPVSMPFSFSTPQSMVYLGAMSPSSASTGITLSRSDSTTSLTSLGTSPLLRLGRGSPSSVGSTSPADMILSSSPSEISFPHMTHPQSHSTPAGLHRRSFSASYTSSPLAASSNAWMEDPGQIDLTNFLPPHMSSERGVVVANSGLSGTLKSGIYPPAGRAASYKRSITFSSFSALGESPQPRSSYMTDVFSSSSRGLPLLPEETEQSQTSSFMSTGRGSANAHFMSAPRPPVVGHQRAQSMLELPYRASLTTAQPFPPGLSDGMSMMVVDSAVLNDAVFAHADHPESF